MPLKKVAIIQARMASTRLPGKVLMDLAGKPMLAHVVMRVGLCRLIDDVIIATSRQSQDDPIEQLAQRLKCACFRGSETDVLARFVGAAKQTSAEIIVRITADCPLIDATVIERVVETMITNGDACDYASNVQQRSFPHGLDTEAFFLDTLMRLDRLGKTSVAREHVTTYLRLEHPELFLTRSVVDDLDHSGMRWTVDTSEDLEALRLIFTQLNLAERVLPYKEVIAFLDKHPEIMQVNAGIRTWQPEQKQTS